MLPASHSEKRHLEPSLNMAFEERDKSTVVQPPIREPQQHHTAVQPTAPVYGDLSHIHTPLKDETITAEIEGRREPSLSKASNRPLQEPALGDDFDLMFEDELRQAVEKNR